MTVVESLYLGMTILLIIAGVALIVPALRGLQVVVYRRAMFTLGISTLIFVVGWLVNYVLYLNGATNPTAGWYLYLASGIIHLYAVWLFSRDFINFREEGHVGFGVDSPTGGFEVNDGE